MGERIRGVSIRNEAFTFTRDAPHRHHHVIADAAGLGVPTFGMEQGFKTSDDRFVSREEAWKIAEAAGQLLERAPTGQPGRLYSEDVW